MLTEKAQEPDRSYTTNYQKCTSSFHFVEAERLEEIGIRNSFVKVLGNGFYLCTMLILILFLFPFTFIIYLSIFSRNNGKISISEKVNEHFAKEIKKTKVYSKKESKSDLKTEENKELKIEDLTQ